MQVIDSFKPTLVLPKPGNAESESIPIDVSRANVGFVKGSLPAFSDETRGLLRQRLLAACIVTTTILVIAYIGNLFLAGTEFWLTRLVFILVLVGCLVLLRNRDLPMRHLRVLEIVVFGVFCVQLVVMMVARLSNYSIAGDLPSVASIKEGYLAAFCILVLTYGIFVPNSWKRGAAVMIPMAALPYGVCAAMRWWNPPVAEALDAIHFTSPIPLTGMAAMVAIYGTHVIHSVRREAFKSRRFGQYRLGQKLGAGGMGEVFKAEHVLLKRPCAIKLIRSENEADSQALADFEKEVKATASLTHWNTVEIFDYGHTDDGTFYYVMELLPGMTLHDMVNRFGPLEPGRVVYLLLQVCDALEEAHSIGLIHRDLKPANIFVSQRGRKYDVAKLLDFGLVKSCLSGQTGASQKIRGTPEYMSPEQATAYDLVDATSDLYALGCVATFALSGHSPFPAENIAQALAAHARQQPESLAAAHDHIPVDLDQVVQRCLMKRPEDRYASCGELAAALRACECADAWSDEAAATWWSDHASEDLPLRGHATEQIATEPLDETIALNVETPNGNRASG